MLSRSKLFLMLILTLVNFACEDENLAPEYPEPMVRVRDMSISPPIYTQAGQEAGQTAGTEMMGGYAAVAGTIMETMAGNNMQAGSTAYPAGSESGNEMPAGTVIMAGNEAGQTAGSLPEIGLSCLEILDCLGNCNSDAMCIDNCLNNGSVEGITALNNLVNCDQSQNCMTDETCLNQQCSAELLRCETGMVGMEMAGAEMAGAEMAGTEMAGAEMGGSIPPAPVGPLSCTETLDCVELCSSGDTACTERCISAASSSAVVALGSLVACGESNMCMDSACFTIACASELSDCANDGQPMQLDCFIDLDCPLEMPYCSLQGLCVECEYAYDCDLGYTCEQNACVELNTDCQNDLYEPNNDQSSATSAELTRLIPNQESLVICGLDQDYYEVEVCANGTVESIVRFDNTQVDIDTEFIFLNAFEYEQISEGVDNVERMSHTNLSNVPQSILLHVYPYDPVSSATYTIELNFTCP